jgi:hypothetical protein
MAKQVNTVHENCGVDDVVGIIDVGHLLKNINGAYSTTEERLNHNDRASHG